MRKGTDTKPGGKCSEVPARRRFASPAGARMAIVSYVEGRYNPVRPYSAPGYRPPVGSEKDNTSELTASPQSPKPPDSPPFPGNPTVVFAAPPARTIPSNRL
jgi:hypothetical protein